VKFHIEMHYVSMPVGMSVVKNLGLLSLWEQGYQGARKSSVIRDIHYEEDETLY